MDNEERAPGLTKEEYEYTLARYLAQEVAYRESDEYKELEARYELSDEEIDQRASLDSAKYELGFAAKVMKDYDPKAWSNVARGLYERVKHYISVRRSRIRWWYHELKYGDTLLGFMTYKGKTEVLLRE